MVLTHQFFELLDDSKAGIEAHHPSELSTILGDGTVLCVRLVILDIHQALQDFRYG
eukprot:COSAG02_NODE_38193_length_432_cov_0.750751_1_plen_55_part_01